MGPEIVVTGLSKSYGDHDILDDVSFTVPKGAFVVVAGENGAGKSTLLKILSTLVRASKGTVVMAGNDIREAPAVLRKAIGCVFHDSVIYLDLTVEENLLFVARLYGIAHPERRVDDLIEMVGLSHRRHDRVRTFSRGMVQRVALARALVCDPDILLLDEPYSGLDASAAAMLDDVLSGFKDRKTILMVSHDVRRCLDGVSHVLVLSEGKLIRFTPKGTHSLEAFLRESFDGTGQGAD